MKILYDHQIFTNQRFGGISRYFAQIIANLPIETQTQIAIKYTNNEYLRTLNIIPEIEKLAYPREKFLSNINFKGKQRIFSILSKLNPWIPSNPELNNKMFSIELLKKQDFDVFHPTYYDDYFLDYIGKKPFILTIHDMIHELYPEMINDPKTIKRKKELANLSSHIIAVSENTKSDIINILGIPENKISVIYHASSLIKNNNGSNLAIPENYFLYVGDRDNYKNFRFFILAIEKWIKKLSNYKIICTGTIFSRIEKEFLKDLELDDVVIHLFIDDINMFNIYKNARALIFPSYYEGFGIPIIEAFDSQCPVILSNTSCFPEIAQDAAIYFSPKNNSQLITILDRIIVEKELRNSLIQKGENRLKSFSWGKSAQQTQLIYNKVV